ncbi:hypothetical protein BO71DRAFT_142728 [Aspergillus ellipticus CBS 707.79]|uniref:Uncharacterized protein n=1 Tax=Aspergillus ellipticus CBS 707.79 TaxID=1448320 RepID=A0A319DI90_9EURO|nr:hypothetical protein BO71DRAFT_142728 [Aspergillus ellipticus CBS 707.79]
MDLSSLEGPPIADSRFTIPSWPPNMSIPSIHLDIPTSPVTAHDRPPRPRSTDAISMHKCLYSYTPVEPQEDTHLCHRCQTLQSPPGTTSSHDSQPRASLSPTLNLPPPPPPPPPTSSFTHQPYRSRSVSDLTLHQPASPMLSTTTTTVTTTTQTVRTTTTQENRLVWLESEKLWFLKPLPSESPSHLTPDYETAPSPAQRGRYRATSHSSTFRDVEFTGDIPPPYERHIYDRPLPPVPVEEQSGGFYGSRWGAVARRRASRAVTG